MGGTADGGQAAGQEVPEDLVTMREAAQAVGVITGTVHSWVKAGRLTAHIQSFQRGHRVSLAAVRALCAPLDPQTPPDARLVYEVVRAVGVSKGRIRIWAQRGLLPSWQSRHGLLVREADVRALVQKQGALLPSDKAGE